MRSINIILRVLVALALIAFLIPDSNAQKPSSGLVLYYTFDEEGVDKIMDQSGTGNNAIVKGTPKWEQGKIGKALRFVADRDHLRVPFSETLIPEKAMTMAVWVNFDGVDKLPSEWGGVIIDDYLWNADGNKCRGYFLGIEKVTSAVRGCFLGVGTSEHCFGLPHPLKGQWTHLAVTWDGHEIKGYVNGEPVKDKISGVDVVKWDGPIGTNQVEDLFIASKEGTQQGYPGALDELAIYNRGLSADDIKRAMVQGHVSPVESIGRLAK